MIFFSIFEKCLYFVYNSLKKQPQNQRRDGEICHEITGCGRRAGFKPAHCENT